MTRQEIIHTLTEIGVNRTLREWEITNTYPVCFLHKWPKINKSQLFLKKISLFTPQIPFFLYLHLPFCTRKCAYCFYATISSPKTELITDYITALKKEINNFKNHINFTPQVESIYTGGGTPSFLNPALLKELIEFIHISFFTSKLKIWTFEISPDTITSEKLSVLKEGKINRISLGVGTLNEKLLKVLNRDVNTQKILDAIEMTLSQDMYLNVDFIYGIPGQTLQNFQDDLEKLCRIGVSEFTLYYLRTNEKTKISKLDGYWEHEIAMFDLAGQILAKHNYVRVRPHHWVRPEALNLWQQYKFAPLGDVRRIRGKQIGFGISAISHINNFFWSNEEDISLYIKTVRQGDIPISRYYELSKEDELARELIYMLETMKIDLNVLKGFGEELIRKFKKVLERFEKLGLLKEDKKGVYLLTQNGLLFYDSLERGLFPQSVNCILKKIK